MGLEDIILISDSERPKHRSRSSSNDSWGHENLRKRRSRSRSLEKMRPPQNLSKDDLLLQEVLRKERDQAAASRKEDVAKKPASFKSAISLQLPVGTSRKQESYRSDSPKRQHVFVKNPAAYKEEKQLIKNDKSLTKEEQLERLRKLKEKYGDASASGLSK